MATAAGADRVRITAWFSGRVQGVGFRYTVVQVAHNHPVSGYVRNLADGRVQLVAEGEQPDVQALLHAVQDAMSGYIHDVQLTQSPATGEHSGFEIRY